MGIREDLEQVVFQYLSKDIANEFVRFCDSRGIDPKSDGAWDRYSDHNRQLEDTIRKATLEQIWSFKKLIERGSTVDLLPGNPADHMGCRMAGIYIGIEPDGYTHS